MTGLACINGHNNSPDAERCATCGLPLVDYEKEVNLLLERLKARLTSEEYAVEKVFVGAGTTGKKILHSFSTTTLKTPDIVYLTFDAPVEKGETEEKAPAIRTRDYVFYGYPPGGGLYASTGKGVALSDAGLEKFLKEADISQANEHQNIILVAAVGGGTGGGVGPAVIHKAKQINPRAHTFALVVIPARAESDQYHFNAYYGVSSLLRFEDVPSADVIVIISYDELRRVTGVGPDGEEIKLEGMIITLMKMMGLDIGHAKATRLARLSQGLGIQAYVPCLGVGRSMEIFGSLTNILESAFLLPMAPIEKANVMVAYLLIRIPNRLADILKDNVVNEEFDNWAKAKFPNLKSSICLITRLEEQSDRVSVCILLGGDSLDNALQHTRRGYQKFCEYLVKSGQMERIGLDSAVLEDIAGNIENYNKNLERWRSA
jgi:hypothetical protein